MTTETDTRSARIARYLEGHAVRCLLLGLLAFAVGAGIWLYLHRNEQIRFSDEADYSKLASRLVRFGNFSFDRETPTAYRPPGYPFFLSLVIRSGLGRVAATGANFLLLGLTAVLCFRFFARRGMRLAAALSSLICLAYPAFFYTAGTRYPQTLGGFLLVALLSVGLGAPRLSLARGLGLGLLAGALVLTIPLLLPTVGILLLGLLLRDLRANLAGVLLAGLCMSLCVSSWTLRNWHALDAFVPVSTNSGRTFLLGNWETTTPFSGVNVDIDEHDEHARSLEGEVAADRYYRGVALEYIRTHPWRSLRLYCAKVLNHFNVWNELATPTDALRWHSLLLALTFWPLLALVLWRIWRWRRIPAFEGEALLLVLYFTAAFFAAFFFTRVRFRLPLDMLMILVAGATLARLYSPGARRPAGSSTVARAGAYASEDSAS